FVAAPSRLSMHFGLWRGREFAAKLRVDVLGILLFLGRGNKVSAVFLESGRHVSFCITFQNQ
ncbi:MAG: hypothetical protein PHE17_21550, partial [Thiothrix sp.]|uniref:hypothetical protein n=1 Tax=Thiothrix sp. TaxID=1032 RepID=UPI0026063271